MKIFEIYNGLDKNGKTLGVLYYDEEKDAYRIEIPEKVDADKLPFVLEATVQQGSHTVNDHRARRWVQDRIVPASRQNIGSILKAAGMTVYDPIAMLEHWSGRCVQDDFAVRRIQ